MKYVLPLLLLLVLFPGTKEAVAQEVLTLDDAIQIGLENNYGIQIVRNSAEMASNNRTLGNAGFLPLLDANATRRESIEDSRFMTDPEAGGVQENFGARSTATSAGVSLNWTLFDGMQMFVNYERLGELEELGMNELRLQLENTVSLIINTYVNIIRIDDQMSVLENSVEVTRERIEIAETMLDLGSGSEYDLLQARTDLNADRAAVLRERNQLNEAKIILNELIARAPETEYDVTEDITITRNLHYKTLHERMMTENASLLMARNEEKIARLEIRNIRGERFPEIVLNSGFTYNRTDGGGFLRFNETEGFNIGVTARIPIFDGFNTSRRAQNAKINQRNSELLLEEEENRINSGFLVAFRTYENSMELVDLEEENLSNAEEVLDIALERFRQGTISALEFREAQRAFLSAESRLINAKYDAKVAETELLRLSGELRHVAL